MRGGEAGVIVFSVVVGVLTQAVIAWVLWAWARHVARRHPRAFWQRVTWLPVVAFFMNVAGVTLTVTFLVRAFGAVSAVDAAHKAAMLSEGINHAMRFTALLSMPAWGLVTTSVVLSLVGQLRRPRDVTPPLPPTTAPRGQ